MAAIYVALYNILKKRHIKKDTNWCVLIYCLKFTIQIFGYMIHVYPLFSKTHVLRRLNVFECDFVTHKSVTVLIMLRVNQQERFL